MSVDNSRTNAVVPGSAILGAEGAKRATAASQGGQVVPGPMITGAATAEREQRAVVAAQLEAAQAADEKAQPGAKKPKTAKKATGPKDVLATPADPIGASETEVIALLTADPEAWVSVLQVEVARPEGVREGVAKAMLTIFNDGSVVANPPTQEIVDSLELALIPAGV